MDHCAMAGSTMLPSDMPAMVKFYYKKREEVAKMSDAEVPTNGRTYYQSFADSLVNLNNVLKDRPRLKASVTETSKFGETVKSEDSAASTMAAVLDVDPRGPSLTDMFHQFSDRIDILERERKQERMAVILSEIVIRIADYTTYRVKRGSGLPNLHLMLSQSKNDTLKAVDAMLFPRDGDFVRFYELAIRMAGKPTGDASLDTNSNIRARLEVAHLFDSEKELTAAELRDRIALYAGWLQEGTLNHPHALNATNMQLVLHVLVALAEATGGDPDHPLRDLQEKVNEFRNTQLAALNKVRRRKRNHTEPAATEQGDVDE